MFLSGINKNSQSVILESVSGNVWTTAETPNILSCNEYREFWITWSTVTIRVGRGGFIGSDQILEYTGLIDVIHSVGLTTAPGVQGQWIHGNING